MSKRLPTPASWNAAHPKKPPTIDLAPVKCPRCDVQMYYPFERHPIAAEEVVRCQRGCIQTTINRSTR